MMGGSHPAYDFTKACLEAGKSVVTSNKEVVARFGAELLEIAVCAQHNNGGIAIDTDWQTSVAGLYCAGEAAGTFGICRPGGTALNSTQVGSARAAQHIAGKTAQAGEIISQMGITADPRAQGVVAMLAIVANVICISVIIKRSVAMGKNPYSNDVFKGTKDYEEAMARAEA